jgi:hypothetical protein
MSRGREIQRRAAVPVCAKKWLREANPFARALAISRGSGKLEIRERLWVTGKVAATQNRKFRDEKKAEAVSGGIKRNLASMRIT